MAAGQAGGNSEQVSGFRISTFDFRPRWEMQVLGAERAGDREIY
jgi:hypothetical protein